MFRERGRRDKERTRNIDVREKHPSIASRMRPYQRPEPAAEACAPTGIQTRELSLCGTAPHPSSHTGWGPAMV